MGEKISMQMSPAIHTSAFADKTFPLKQVFRKFGWLAFDFCFFKEMFSFLESIDYFVLFRFFLGEQGECPCVYQQLLHSGLW